MTDQPSMTARITWSTLVNIAYQLDKIREETAKEDDAFDRIARLGQRALGVLACTVVRIDREAEQLIHVAIAGFPSHYKDRVIGRSIPLKSGDSDIVLDHDLVMKGKPIACGNLQQDGQGVARPKTAQQLGLDYLRAYPIKSDDYFGYLSIFTAPNQPPTETQERGAEILAIQTQALIEYVNEKNRNRNFIQFMQQIQTVQNADDVHRRALEGIRDLLGVRGSAQGAIGQLDVRHGKIKYQWWNDAGKAEYKELALHEGMTGMVVNADQPEAKCVDNLDEYQGPYIKVWGERMRSAQVIPLITRNALARTPTGSAHMDKLVGALNFESTETNAFRCHVENKQLDLLATVAAMEIDRLDQEKKRAGLSRITKAIKETDDRGIAIKRVSKGIQEHMGASMVNVSLVFRDEAGHKRIRTEHLFDDTLHRPEEINAFKEMANHKLDENDIQAYVCEVKEIVVPEDDDLRYDRRIYDRFHHDRLKRIIFPMLTASSEIVGTVEVGFPRRSMRAIYESDVNILQGYVDLIVEAVERRKLKMYERIRHELSTPAVGMRSNAEYLRKHFSRLYTTQHDKLERKLDDLNADADMMIYQIVDLEYALFGTIPTTIPKEVYVHRDIIIKTINQLRPLLRDRGLDPDKIYYDPSDARRIRMIVDKARLSQVVFNLLSNSIKYARDDPALFAIQVDVDTRKDRNFYLVSFKDWGMGINQEDATRIFEEGYRTLEATRKDPNGSGLGLAISRRIMRDMNGDLVLINKRLPTEFQVKLPKPM